MNGFLLLLKVILIALFLFNTTLLSDSLAQESIDEDIYVEYEMLREGDTNFQYEIQLSVPEGKTTAISNYNLDFPFEKISFETIRSEQKHLRANLERQEGRSNLSIALEDRILSPQEPISIILEGNIEENLLSETTFTKILNLSTEIAGIKPKEIVFEYPIEFGEPSSTSIEWDIEKMDEKYRLKSDEVGSIINLIWGEHLIYNFQISKTLTNTSPGPITSFDISLPKAHYSQKITISNINPTPHFAYKDKEDNLFLSYNLKPNDQINVNLQGQIINTKSPDERSLSPFKRPILTEQEEYWKLTDSYEKNRFQVYLSRSGIESDHIEDMDSTERQNFYKLAYQYVKDRLNMQETKKISMESETRQGADKALNNKHNSPPEDFVDLLSAIFRSYGVPTKMIEGYVVQKDGFFHSWLQYWNAEEGWKMLDPALANYTGQKFFGSNFEHHVVFLERGHNYINPRMTFFTQENIEITLGDDKNEEKLSIEEEIHISPLKKTTNQVMGEITIQNVGNTIVSIENLTQDKNLNLGIYNPFQLVVPKQSIKIPFAYNKTNAEQEKIENQYVSVNNSTTTNTLELSTQEARYWWWNTFITITTLLIIWIIIYIMYLILKITHTWIKNYYQ